MRRAFVRVSDGVLAAHTARPVCILLADPGRYGCEDMKMTDDTAAFGQRLSACRRSALLSQQEMAERSGLSVRTIGNLERGCTSWPHPDSVRRLADALKLHDQARAEFVAA